MTEVAVANTAYHCGAVGVVSRRETPPDDMQLAALPAPKSGKPTAAYRKLQDRFDCLFFNAVGEGQINVCGKGGDIELGDIIVASDIRGNGQRADMETAPSLHTGSAIVARSREPVTFDIPSR